MLKKIPVLLLLWLFLATNCFAEDPLAHGFDGLFHTYHGLKILTGLVIAGIGLAIYHKVMP